MTTEEFRERLKTIPEDIKASPEFLDRLSQIDKEFQNESRCCIKSQNCRGLYSAIDRKSRAHEELFAMFGGAGA